MHAVFTARTNHGTILAIDTSNGSVRHCGDAELGGQLTTLRILTGGPLGSRCLPFGVHPATQQAFLPHSIAPGSGILFSTPKSDGPPTLRIVATQLFVSAIPGGGVDANRVVPSAWEHFTLVADATLRGDPAFVAFLTKASALFGTATTWSASMAALLASPPSEMVAAMVEAIWPLLTIAEFDRLADRLQRDKALARRLIELFGGDFYAVTVLPSLLSWLTGRQSLAEPASANGPQREGTLPRSWRWSETATAFAVTAQPRRPPRSIGPELDRLARDGYDGWLSSLPHACSASLRARVTPSRGPAIVATARSEGVYLLEWIAHHRLLGVEAIYLYTNNNDDDSDSLLGALHAAGVINWTPNYLSAGVSAQNKAYGHALNVSTDVLQHRWALFIDLDEFLVLNPDRYDDIGEFARWHEMRQTEAVGMNWVMVGSSRELQWQDKPLTRRNTALINDGNLHIKVMMAPRYFIQAHPHFPFADRRRAFTFRLASGDLHQHRNQPPEMYHAQAFTDHPSEEHASIYHFYYKSLEEFVWKYSRNRGDHPMSDGTTFQFLDQGTVSAFLEQQSTTDYRENDQLLRCSPDLIVEMERLRALAGVRSAEETVTVRFRARLAEVKRRLLQSGHLKALGGPGHELERLLNV